MSSYQFGAGQMWATPLTDAFGNAIANPTPYFFGVTQEVSIDESSDMKPLYGQNAFPVAIGRGKQKLSVKVKFAQMYTGLINALWFGQPAQQANTSYQDVYDTTGILIPATPFQITITTGAASLVNIQIPSSGTFVAILGILNANGIAMTRVASAPTTGQFSLSSTTLTFAAADTGLRVFICYQYTIASAGQNIAVQNLPMGYAPTFQADFQVVYQGKPYVRTFYQCIATGQKFQTKLDDFAVPELDFECFADGTNRVTRFSMLE